MNEKQQTIRQSISLSGIGLHTGQTCTLTIHAAAVNHGFKFKRVDLPNQPIVTADARYVVDTSRGTTLEQNGAQVHTVEHLLAALVGLSIDNVLLELDNSEVPILDGSALKFIEALESAGIEEQNADRDYFEIEREIRFYDEKKDVEFIALPSSEYRLTAMVDYNSPVLGTQHATLNNIDNFKQEIAPCRTFCFLHELETLAQSNLIKGGDLDNAVVVVDRVVKQEELNNLAKLLNKPTVEVTRQGILNNVDLLFQNEPARHKLLDVVGDLALVGAPIKGHVIASKPGHSSNVEFAKVLQEAYKKHKVTRKVPKYDPNKPPVLDVNEILTMLPHRSPFVFIDKVIELSPTHIVGIKNITFNEPFFAGHFPNNPVMPGVLIVEAMAQTGGVLALKTMDDPYGYWTYFTKVEYARFKNKVVPGDTLVFALELVEPIRRGIVRMQGNVYVGNVVVAEALLQAQLVKKS